MGILDFFKKRDPRQNHDFDEKDRALAAERKKLNTELANMKQRHAMEEERERHELEMMRIRAEIDDIAAELEPDDDDAPMMKPEDVMVMKLVDKLFSAPGSITPTASTVTPPAAPPAGGVSIPDERLAQYWEQAPPNIRALAPRCTDEQVKEFVRAQIPGADADTQERALRIIRATSV